MSEDSDEDKNLNPSNSQASESTSQNPEVVKENPPVEPQEQETSTQVANDTFFKVPSSSINVPSSSIDNGEKIDPITQAIREQILQKQREILRTYFSGQYLELAEQNKDDEKFKTFLANLNAEQKNAALNNKDVKAELENIELAGYKSVHKEFSSSFKTISWDGSSGKDDIRAQTITDENGTEICTLNETTHKTAKINVTKADSDVVVVDSYRTIDFPTKLANNDTMHLSMVALDEKGERPPVDKAVYFTAHYEEGKLKEVSSPIPLKFMGEGKEAVGYIEHGGKVYTLPVTRGKYEEMMLEVVVNKGQNVNLSQTVMPKAEDLTRQQEQTIGQKQEIGEGKSPTEQPNSALETASEQKVIDTAPSMQTISSEPQNLEKPQQSQAMGQNQITEATSSQITDPAPSTQTISSTSANTEKTQQPQPTGQEKIDASILNPDQQLNPNSAVKDGVEQAKNTELEKVKNTLSNPTTDINVKNQGILDVIKGILDNNNTNLAGKRELIEKITTEIANSSLEEKSKADIAKNMSTAIAKHGMSLDDLNLVIESMVTGVANSNTPLEHQTQMIIGIVNGASGKSEIPNFKVGKAVENGINNSNATDDNKLKLKDTVQQENLRAVEELEASLLKGLNETPTQEEISSNKASIYSEVIKATGELIKQIPSAEVSNPTTQLEKTDTLEKTNENIVSDNEPADLNEEIVQDTSKVLNDVPDKVANRAASMIKTFANSLKIPERKQPELEAQKDKLISEYKAIGEKYKPEYETQQGSYDSTKELNEKKMFIGNLKLDDKDKIKLLSDLIKHEGDNRKMGTNNSIKMLTENRSGLENKVADQDKSYISNASILKPKNKSGVSV